MRKFSDRELLRAYAQIERARAAEREQAERAARWLVERCGLLVTATLPPPYIEQGKENRPYLPAFRLVISRGEFDTINDWLASRLTTPPALQGIPREESGFWLELGRREGFPAGTRYYCHTKHVEAFSFGC